MRLKNRLIGFYIMYFKQRRKRFQIFFPFNNASCFYYKMHVIANLAFNKNKIEKRKTTKMSHDIWKKKAR